MPAARPTTAADAKGGTATLYLDGSAVGRGRIGATVPMLFSADETRLRERHRNLVSDDYGRADSESTGRVRWVQLDIDEAAEDVDHLITAGEWLRIAMTRQQSRGR